MGNVYEDWMDVQNDAKIDFLPIEFYKRKNNECVVYFIKKTFV
jgi:hypothetical protein